jgi:transcriptional regulator with XRE-family HTH domain
MSKGSLSAALGRRLQRLRLDSHIPLAHLAKKVGLSGSALLDIEEGRTQPSIGTLGDIAEQFGVSIAELVREARNTPSDPARLQASPKMSAEEIAIAIVELPDGVDKLAVVDAAAVRYAFELAGGNKSRAARLLGLERKAVERRLERHLVR